MAKDDRRKRLKYACISTAVLVPAVSALVYLSVTPIDLTNHKSRIEPILSSRVEGTVTFDTISIKFLPSPDIRLTGLKASGDEGEVVSARRLRLRAALLPFLLGKTVLKDFEAEGLSLFVRRHRTGSLNIMRFFKAEEAKKDKGRLSIKSLKLVDGSVRYIDEKPPRTATFEFSSINAFSYDTGRGNVYGAEAVLDGSPVSITGIEKDGVVKWTGTVKDLHASVIDPYFADDGVTFGGTSKIFLSYDSGLANPINAIVFGNALKINHPALFAPLSMPSASARVELSSERDGKRDINLKDALLRLSGATFTGSYSASGAGDRREFSFSLASSPIKATGLKALLSIKALKGPVVVQLNNVSPTSGTITIGELAARGLTRELKGGAAFRKPGAVQLSASVNGLSFTHKGLKLPITGVSGSIDLRDDALKLEGFSGSYGRETVRGFEGRVKGLTGAQVYEFSIDAALEAGETIEIARDLVNAPEAKDALKMADAGGAIDLNAKAWGSFRSKALPRYSGELTLQDGWLSYDKLPRIDKASASITFDDEKVKVDSVSLSDGHSSVRLYGTLNDYMGGDPFFDLALSSVVSGATLYNTPALESIRKDLLIAGEAALDARIVGRKGSFSAKASLDALNAAIGYKKYLRKEEDYPFRVDADLSLDGKRLGVKGLSLAFGSSKAEVSGEISLKDKAYDLSLRSKGCKIADIDDVSPFLSRDFESSGDLSFMIRATKTPGKDLPVIEGEARVEDARFQSPYIAKPVEKINASASFKGNRGKVVLDRLSVGETELSGYVDVLDIEGRRVEFALNSPRLLTDDFMVWSKKDGVEYDKPTLPEGEKADGPLPITGSGRIRIAGGAIGAHQFKDLKIDVRLAPDTIVIEPLSAEIDNGTFLGKAEIYRGKDELLSFRADAEFSNIRLESFISGFGAKDAALAGTVRGALALTGKRGAHPFVSGLNGSGRLKAEHGRVWKFPILSRIFSFVNIVSIDEAFREGLQYKRITGDVKIKDGVLTTENLALESDTLRMSAMGEIDFPDSHIDALLALHPFVTIDKIISSIPLAGWIITGREKSTVSMYFSMEGPLNKPEIDPVPTKSVSTPVFGILERLLEAPVEILQEIK